MRVRNMMRCFAFCMVSLIIAFKANAQIDTTAYTENSPVTGLLKTQRSFIFIDFTNSTWVNRPGEIETHLISGGFNFNLSYDFHVVKNAFSIAPGIAYSNATVKNNSYYYYLPVGDDAKGYTQLAPYSDSVEYLKNKFSSSYIDVPIELRFRIRPDERGKNFWIAPGFRAGILISDFWKHKYEDADGDVIKSKVYGIVNVEQLHYGLSLRAGYYKFGFYTFYALNNLFVKDKGPELTPFSIGLTFTPF